MQSKVYKEAKKALNSIFTDDDLSEFSTLPLNEKKERLSELTAFVTGIRLFNRDCAKGGYVPTLLNDAVVATIGLIEQRLLLIMNYINTLTTVIDNSYTTECDEENRYLLKLSIPNGVCKNDVHQFRDVLLVYRQYEMYIRILLIEVEKIDKLARIKYTDFQEALQKLHETVKYKILIPTVNVIPLFTAISKEWCELQNLTILISHLNEMLINLHLFTTNLKVDGEKITILIGSSEILTDADRLDRTANMKIEPYNTKEARIISSTSVNSFDKMAFEYLGFCPWKMIETGGALIPGNPNMGVVQVKNLLFTFSSVEAAAAFECTPLRYVLRGINLARSKIELINLLGLTQQMEHVRKIDQLVYEIPPIILKCNAGVQTEMHAIPILIDPHYKWNVWDWKRQAILLADISRLQTHSTQTHKSQSHGSIRVQTYSPREVSAQTKKDNYTNIPPLSNFIYGLRGRKDDKQHIITLTRPVHE